VCVRARASTLGTRAVLTFVDEPNPDYCHVFFVHDEILQLGSSPGCAGLAAEANGQGGLWKDARRPRRRHGV